MIVDVEVIRAAVAAGSHRYPYAAWMPLPEATRQPRIAPHTLVLHSMAGPRLTTLDALRAYMHRDDITGESTFILDMAGRMAQLVEGNQRADCNAKANAFAGSVETQDTGAGELEQTAWTPEQVEQLAGLAAWYHLRYGVRLERPGAWNAGGVDGHRAWPEWSIYVGKTCPGSLRYRQIDDVLARARQLLAPPTTPTTPPQEDNDMPNADEILTELRDLRGVVDRIAAQVNELDVEGDARYSTATVRHGWIQRTLQLIRDRKTA